MTTFIEFAIKHPVVTLFLASITGTTVRSIGHDIRDTITVLRCGKDALEEKEEETKVECELVEPEAAEVGNSDNGSEAVKEEEANDGTGD